MPARRTTQKTETPVAAPTALSFNSLQTAFDFFNRELFGGKLPPAMILLHRKRHANGYFWAERFGHRDLKDQKLHEIALNPTTMRGRSDTDVLSTLVHEMCHHEQQCFGKPGKGAYHNAEWATMMDRVGLTPRAIDRTGMKTDGRTGTKVSHDIALDGPFAKACAALLKTGFSLPYSERVFTAAEKTRATVKKASKTKYTCPSCDMAVWGKPGLSVGCIDCDEAMEEVS